MFGNSITKFLKLDNLISNLTGYVETKVDLVKHEVKEQVTDGLSKAITYIIIAFVFSLVIIFLSFGVAMILVQSVGVFWGYSIVAGFYLIVGLILLANRDRINKRFARELSDSFNKKK